MNVLDCTLRDGGYYTGWNFSKNLFENYLKTISKLNVSIIELGYLSDAKDNNGLFYHLNKGILSKAKSLIRKDQKIFAMINFKEIKSVNQLDKLARHAAGYRIYESPLRGFRGVGKRVSGSGSTYGILSRL